MHLLGSGSGRRVAVVGTILVLASFAVLLPLSAAHAASGVSDPSLQLIKTLVPAPPTGDKGPDDIAFLSTPGVDNGSPVIWTAYQNGIQANGSAGTPGGPTQTTVAGYDALSGALVKTIQVTGKSDGLSSDPVTGQLISTLNEDSNSGLAVIDPASGAVIYYTYSPNPAVSGNGGTDSIAFINGNMYLAHSNPNDVTQAAVYLATLNSATHVAALTPVYYDDSMATSINTGATVKLGLTDPDTNFAMPLNSSFPGELAQISQGDGQIVFTAPGSSGASALQVLNVTDNRAGNVPPIDGFAVATSDRGTLFVVDAKAGTIQAFDTSGWPTGTVFVGEPSDNGNPLVGTLNLQTGVITPFGNAFGSPKGLLFVPTAAVPSAATTTVTTTVVSTFSSPPITLTSTATTTATQSYPVTVTTTVTQSNSALDDTLYGAVAVLALVAVGLGFVAARRGK